MLFPLFSSVIFVEKVRLQSMYSGVQKCMVHTSSNILYICELRVIMLECIEKSKKICEKNCNPWNQFKSVVFLYCHEYCRQEVQLATFCNHFSYGFATFRNLFGHGFATFRNLFGCKITTFRQIIQTFSLNYSLTFLFHNELYELHELTRIDFKLFELLRQRKFVKSIIIRKIRVIRCS